MLPAVARAQTALATNGARDASTPLLPPRQPPTRQRPAPRQKPMPPHPPARKCPQSSSDGGEESQCGWLRDRYGLSWQVVPGGMEELFADPDPERARRAMEAMLGMRKIDVAALRRAAEGAGAD